MNTGVRRIGLAALAVRLQPLADVGSYIVLLAPTESVPYVATDLAEEIATLDGRGLVHLVESSTIARGVIGDLRSRPEGTVVIDASRYEDQDWQFLDRGRSALARGGPTVLVMAPRSFDELMRVAPNLASWLGALVFEWDQAAGYLSEDEKAKRLDALRVWSGMTDAEVLEAASRGELRRDPEFAEWLVLLRRGDLIDVS